MKLTRQGSKDTISSQNSGQLVIGSYVVPNFGNPPWKKQKGTDEPLPAGKDSTVSPLPTESQTSNQPSQTQMVTQADSDLTSSVQEETIPMNISTAEPIEECPICDRLEQGMYPELPHPDQVSQRLFRNEHAEAQQVVREYSLVFSKEFAEVYGSDSSIWQWYDSLEGVYFKMLEGANPLGVMAANFLTNDDVSKIARNPNHRSFCKILPNTLQASSKGPYMAKSFSQTYSEVGWHYPPNSLVETDEARISYVRGGLEMCGDPEIGEVSVGGDPVELTGEIRRVITLTLYHSRLLIQSSDRGRRDLYYFTNGCVFEWGTDSVNWCLMPHHPGTQAYKTLRRNLAACLISSYETFPSFGQEDRLWTKQEMVTKADFPKIEFHKLRYTYA